MISIQKKDNNFGIFREEYSCANWNFWFALTYLGTLAVIGVIVFLVTIVI